MVKIIKFKILECKVNETKKINILLFLLLGKLEFVKFLVENGADVNAKDNNNRTPLQIAFQSGNLNQMFYFYE